MSWIKLMRIGPAPAARRHSGTEVGVGLIGPAHDVGGDQLSDAPLRDRLLGLVDERVVTPVMADKDRHAGSLRLAHKELCLGDVVGDRLLDQDRYAGCDAFAPVLCMQPVGGRDDDAVRPP